jgi:hypothetical protein
MGDPFRVMSFYGYLYHGLHPWLLLGSPSGTFKETPRGATGNDRQNAGPTEGKETGRLEETVSELVALGVEIAADGQYRPGSSCSGSVL